MLVAIAVVGLALVAITLLRRRALPSHVARRRLDAQIAELERRLDAASVADDRLIERQVQQIQQRWIEEQLTTTPIESLDIPGIGPAMHQTLRDHGIATLDDLGHLGRKQVPGVGDKKRAQLVTGHKREVKTVLARAAALDHAALDHFTDGRLSEVVKNHEADELGRHRQIEDLRIRLAELRRRRGRA